MGQQGIAKIRPCPICGSANVRVVGFGRDRYLKCLESNCGATFNVLEEVRVERPRRRRK